MDKLIGSAMLLGLLVVISYFALVHPLFTWDLVPYVAATLSAQVNDPSALHTETYQLLQTTLSNAQFNGLVAGPYASDLWQNSEHFTSQLTMYYVKPLYVAVLQGAALLGANPVTAIMGLSLGSGLLICILMFQWLKSATTAVNAAALVILFALTARLIDLSRVPTPDNFSALAVLTGLYLLLVMKWWLPAIAVLCASVLIRTNNMIFVGLVFTYLIWARYALTQTIKDSKLKLAALGLGVSVSLYLLTNALFDYQWWRLFYHTFVESQVDIAGFDRAFSFATYLSVVKAALQQVIAPGAILATVLPGFLVLILISLRKTLAQTLAGFFKPSDDSLLDQLVLLCVPVFFTVMLLFPLTLGWDRFFTAYYALILIYSITQWRTRSPDNKA
jgi:hypothetical protein